jgi:hypothetical protein
MIPLVLPRDVTAEKIGTVIGIVGATAAGKGTKPGCPTPYRPPQDRARAGLGAPDQASVYPARRGLGRISRLPAVGAILTRSNAIPTAIGYP